MTPPRGGPLARFVRSEAAAGATLIAAAAVALAWSNSPWHAAYASLLATSIAGIRPIQAVNDGLMTLFFLAVTLEIRREMREGELASPRLAAAPVLAALGGMALPAAIYAATTRHDPAALRGWAIPVATDIAFALAALRLLGRRAPAGLRVFLTALAIIDDLGAILIIALFYATALNLPALAAALALWAALATAGRRAAAPTPLLLAGGAALWVATLRSGLHPTLAGVALAFTIPLAPGGASPAHRLEQALSPWITWLVLPLFGLANAGLPLTGLPPQALAAPVVLGTLFGLLLGKPLGVLGAIFAAIRVHAAHLPVGLDRPALLGGAQLCGIGFTMSLFIADLAFRGTEAHDQAKLAIFAASLLSALLGLVLLLVRRRPAHAA